MSNPYGPLQGRQQPPGGQHWSQQPSGQPGVPPQGWGHPGFTQPVPGHQAYRQAPYGHPQQSQPGAGGEPGFTVPPPRKKGSPVPWILGAGGALVVVAVLVTGFVAPGFFLRTTFDAQAVQQGVRQTMEGAYGISGVESVTCPSGQPVEPGATFDCEVAVEGSTVSVTITVKDRDGAYEVGHPR